MRQQRGIPLRLVATLNEHGADERILRTAQARRCGDCTYCCTFMGVDAVEKKACEPCRHLKAERPYLVAVLEVGHTHPGCDLYPFHPQECHGFYCTWRLGYGGKDARPDRAHLVASLVSSNNPDNPGTQWQRMDAFLEPGLHASGTGFPPSAQAMVRSLSAGGWMVRLFVAGDDPLDLPLGVACDRSHPEFKAASAWADKHRKVLVTTGCEVEG